MSFRVGSDCEGPVQSSMVGTHEAAEAREFSPESRGGSFQQSNLHLHVPGNPPQTRAREELLHPKWKGLYSGVLPARGHWGFVVGEADVPSQNPTQARSFCEFHIKRSQSHGHVFSRGFAKNTEMSLLAITTLTSDAG